ncbi:hypothetical protein WI41_22920 [Burkholderia latens]|uniref:Uncharacterized protein n=1 Tax=Burkholderia latens TaxID=488446 RepID=A0AAP1CAM2_9BURK|nr:hypothetical protein WI41_22920 [Burkholderia latens]
MTRPTSAPVAGFAFDGLTQIMTSSFMPEKHPKVRVKVGDCQMSVLSGVDARMYRSAGSVVVVVTALLPSSKHSRAQPFSGTKRIRVRHRILAARMLRFH